MDFDQQLGLLLVGASISLLASVITLVASTLLNHWLQGRSQRKAKKETVLNLMGQLFIAGGVGYEEIRENLEAIRKVLRGEANDDNVLQIEMDVLIGMVEALLKRSQEDTVAEE